MSKKVDYEPKDEGSVTVNRSLLSIDYASAYFESNTVAYQLTTIYAENLETADYLKEGDTGFKKPKVSPISVSSTKHDLTDYINTDQEKASFSTSPRRS